jgi:branched-chain amino acid transport system permease protein
MSLLLQLIANGIISGSLYALLGISWGIIFATTKTFHFAHGIVFVISAYMVFLVSELIGLPLAFGIVFSIIVAVAAGISIDYVIYRPLRNSGAPPFVIFIASMGTLIVIQQVIHLVFQPDPKIISGIPRRIILLGDVAFTSLHVFTAVTSWLLVVALIVFLNKSKLGKAIRAVSDNPEMAEILGIGHQRIYSLAYGIGSALVAVAAILYLFDKAATPDMGPWAIFTAFIAVFIGGIGSMAGAALGGLIIGLAENIGIWQLPSEWKGVLVFVILMIVIIFMPQGLLSASGKSKG